MKTARKHIFLWSMVFVLSFLPSLVHAKEVIKNYHSRIEIKPDGGLHITETIDVIAEGKEIRRGIYRDLPLHRRTFLGGILPSTYRILSVKRDGQTEKWHTKTDKENGNFRLYVGQSSVILKPARYVYEITYTTPNQVFFFDEYDELNWNAIGTGWVFPIERGSAKIILPQNAKMMDFTAYTGAALSRAQNFTMKEYRDAIVVETSQPLKPREGMTVALSWPKGYVTPAEDMTGSAFFWKQHSGLQLILNFFLLLCGYYYFAWKTHGVDPKSRGLAPFYSPPEGISPAMAAVIHTMGDAGKEKCMTAAIISLASKGYLTIEEKKSGHYIVSGTSQGNDRPEISEDEDILYQKLKNGMTIRSSSESLVKTAKEHREKLTDLCHKHYFFKNGWWWAGGFVIVLAAIIALSLQVENTENLLIGTLFMGIFGGMSSVAMIHGIKTLFTAPGAQKAGAVFLIIWASGFSIGGFMGLYLLTQTLSWLVILTIILMVILVVKMRHIMKAPTRKGRGVMDHLNGLRYYMEAVEEKVLKKFDPPEMSRELYEKYLPYAVALDVESKWADKFAPTVGSAIVAAAATAPHWYTSSSSRSGSGFSAGNMVNNFSSTLSAASTSNSSSSGGGGGSSGGGGGGGGGGGW